MEERVHKGKSAWAHKSHKLALVLLIWSLYGQGTWAGLVPRVDLGSSRLVKALSRPL